MKTSLDEANMLKFVNILFIICFFLILITPIMKINKGINQVSEIDNRKLVEFPMIQIGKGFRKGFESYLADRIGYRAKMLDIYQKIHAVLFIKLVHPSYMYGEDRYVFFKGSYIDDYQHLNIDTLYIDKCAGYIETIYRYLESRNIKFLYFLIPDKKSIYKDFFPKTINVKGKKSQAMMLIEKVKSKNIPYLYPVEDFLKAKETLQIYNKQYDAGHWNEHGAFIGHFLVVQKLQEYFPQINLLEKSDFLISMVTKTSLPVSHFEIKEDVPVYKLKKRDSRRIHEYDDSIKADRHVVVYRNSRNTDKPKIMIFHDSYFLKLDQYYGDNFSEIIVIHSFENLKNLEYFINIFEPDIVLLENVERVISPKGMLFSIANMKKTALTDYSYLDLPNSENEASIIINAKGKQVLLTRDDSLSTITGTAVNFFDGRHGSALFAKLNDKYYAVQYPSDGKGESNEFSLTLKAETLRKSEVIEFILISSNGKSKLKSISFPIVR